MYPKEKKKENPFIFYFLLTIIMRGNNFGVEHVFAVDENQHHHVVANVPLTVNLLIIY